MKNIYTVFFIALFIIALGILVIFPVSLKFQIIISAVVFIGVIILIAAYFKADKKRSRSRY
jgi:membrane protein implicated in regulation of membrane protease activity